MHVYRDCSASPHEGRWASVIHAIEAVLPLESSLKLAWNLQSYLFTEGEGRGEGVRAVEINEVDKVIGSSFVLVIRQVHGSCGRDPS